MQWLNEPPVWRDENDILLVTTGDRTDFWRETHYGFIRDDGHLRYRTVEGDFTAELSFAGDYRDMYDQAGIMIRADERTWIKAGIEFVGGRQMLSTVVTRDFSDWSTAAAPLGVEWMTLRLTKHGSAIRIEWAAAATHPNYHLMRLAYLPDAKSLDVGPMCCSPQRAGFEARFRNFRVIPAIQTDLHA